MTTDRDRIVLAARQILKEAEEGHQHSQDRIDWAKSIVMANLLWTPKQEEKK